MHKLTGLIVSLAALVLSGCNMPFFTHPLSAQGQEMLDPNLLGTWQFKDGTETIQMRIKAQSATAYTIEISDLAHPKKSEYYTAFNSTLGTGHYVNIVLADKGAAPKYVFAKYTVVQNVLVFSLLVSGDKMRSAVLAGHLNGATVKGSSDDTTMSTATLRPLFASQGERLFGWDALGLWGKPSEARRNDQLQIGYRISR